MNLAVLRTFLPSLAGLRPVLLVVPSIVFAASCIPYDDSTPPPGQPCISLDEGLRFQVELVEPYDAASESLYVESIVPTVHTGWEPCTLADGLAPGRTFEFATGRYSPRYDQETCSYREMVAVAGLGVGAGRYEHAVSGVDGQTLAGWTRTARLEGEPVRYTLLITAPEGAPFGARVRGQLPPSIVTRYLRSCKNVWVATLREVAP